MWHVQTVMVYLHVLYRLYDDLNDFLETKERVVSITRIMSMVRLSNHACSVDARVAMYIDEDMFILERQSYHLACSILLQRKRFSANVTDDDKSKLDLATPKLFIRPKQVQIYYYFNSLLHIKFIVIYVLQVEEAIEIALETSCRVHGSQEGVTKKEILQFVKKIFNLTEKQVDEAQEKSSQQVVAFYLSQVSWNQISTFFFLSFSRLNCS